MANKIKLKATDGTDVEFIDEMIGAAEKFPHGATLKFRSVITDVAGNVTTGAASATLFTVNTKTGGNKSIEKCC